MDSISQIVLGAAVGEAVLGKKLGNKAMVWGAIGGTIPDLDVLASPIISKLQALAFHRGITHSIFFDIVGGIFFGWLVYKLYDYRHSRMNTKKNVSLKEWSWLFFWTFFTHALLDCFTMFGTQLFAPFSDYRVAFSTIAVVDFFYTIPFITCLIIASRHARGSNQRRKWNWRGIMWSCFYLLLTFCNKLYVTEVYKTQLADQNISYDSMVVGPTIMTNFLWTATMDSNVSGQIKAGDKDVFYIGQYSIFDKSPIEFLEVRKNKYLLGEYKPDDKTIETLDWFTSGFINVMNRKDCGLQMNDLRFGTFTGKADDENDFIFRFPIQKNYQGYFELEKVGKGPASGNRKEMMRDIWERIKGR